LVLRANPASPVPEAQVPAVLADITGMTDRNEERVHMEMVKTAAASSGSSRPQQPSPAAPTAPEEAPVTTRKDVEQNTYTSQRSEQLREGNTVC
jgi:hypothetical protein